MDKCESKCKYVKVDKVLDKLDILSGIMVDKNDALVMKEIIKDMQGEDVEPVVHGSWVNSEFDYAHCSRCAFEQKFQDYMTPFCPNCGAKMDGGSE